MKKNVYMIHSATKLLMLALLTASLLGLSGCGNNDGKSKTGATPQAVETAKAEATPETILDGFVQYTKADVPIRIQYPSTWTVLDKDIIKTDDGKLALEGISAANGVDSSIYAAAIQNVTAIWYDPSHAINNFTPNMTLLIAPSTGMTQESMLDDQFRVKLIDSIKSQFTSSSFSNYKELAEPTLKKMGDNFFLTFESSYSMGFDAESYLALTVIDGNLCTFTFSTGATQLESLLPQYDEMLSTLKAAQ